MGGWSLSSLIRLGRLAHSSLLLLLSLTHIICSSFCFCLEPKYHRAGLHNLFFVQYGRKAVGELARIVPDDFRSLKEDGEDLAEAAWSVAVPGSRADYDYLTVTEHVALQWPAAGPAFAGVVELADGLPGLGPWRPDAVDLLAAHPSAVAAEASVVED